MMVRLVLLLGVLGVAACSAPPPENPCHGSNDKVPVDGGFGGTGQAPADCPAPQSLD